MTVMNNAVESVLDAGRERGLEMDVIAVERQSTSISFQARKLDKFSRSETRQLGVRVLDGLHEGVAYTEDLTPDSLAEMLAEAQANAKMIQREFVSTLPGASRCNEIKGLFVPELAETPVEAKIEAARVLEATALDTDSRLQVPSAVYNDTLSTIILANSAGFSGSYRASNAMVWATCTAKDGDAIVTGKEYKLSRGFSGLSTAAVGKIAAERTLERLGAARPSTGRYTVIFDQHSAADMIGKIVSYFSAKAVMEKTSPLAGKLGQNVFASKVSIMDDPFFSSAPGCRPFDEEGFASQRTTLVENGVLKNFLTNSVLAKKLGLKHTASGSRSPSTDLDVGATNILVRPGTPRFQELVGADKKVIVITDILGRSGFRSASGDFSLPVEGMLYENGQRSGALKDFLISGNILQLFAGIEAVGNDVIEPISNIICPPLLVRDLNISGQA